MTFWVICCKATGVDLAQGVRQFCLWQESPALGIGKQCWFCWGLVFNLFLPLPISLLRRKELSDGGGTIDGADWSGWESPSWRKISYSLKVDRTEGKATKNGKMLWRMIWLFLDNVHGNWNHLIIIVFWTFASLLQNWPSHGPQYKQSRDFCGCHVSASFWKSVLVTGQGWG